MSGTWSTWRIEAIEMMLEVIKLEDELTSEQIDELFG